MQLLRKMRSKFFEENIGTRDNPAITNQSNSINHNPTTRTHHCTVLLAAVYSQHGLQYVITRATAPNRYGSQPVPCLFNFRLT